MKKKEIAVLITLTFIVIVIWIIAEIVHTKPSVPIEADIQKLLEPVEPTFDQEIIDQIKKMPTPPKTIINLPPPSATPIPSTTSTPVTPSPSPAASGQLNSPNPSASFSSSGI